MTGTHHSHKGAPTNTRLLVRQIARITVSNPGSVAHSMRKRSSGCAKHGSTRRLTTVRSWNQVIERLYNFCMDLGKDRAEVTRELHTNNTQVIRIPKNRITKNIAHREGLVSLWVICQVAAQSRARTWRTASLNDITCSGALRSSSTAAGLVRSKCHFFVFFSLSLPLSLSIVLCLFMFMCIWLTNSFNTL